MKILPKEIQELAHGRAWQWVENEVINDAPDLQFTGAKAETITLRGAIYTVVSVGGTLQMPILSLLAGRGVPMLLVSGLGLVLGFWVIEGIEETKRHFTSFGQPQKIEFNITLKRVGNLKKALAMLRANPASALGLDSFSSLNPMNMNMGNFGL